LLSTSLRSTQIKDQTVSNLNALDGTTISCVLS
jgi:hypothetical protein